MTISETNFFAKEVSLPRHFFNSATLAPRKKFIIRAGGYDHCTPRYYIKRSSFPYLCVELVVGGKGKFVCDGQEHKLKYGRLFCYKKNQPHEIASDPRDVLKKYFVSIEVRQNIELFTSVNFTQPIDIEGQILEGIRQTMEAIMQTGGSLDILEPGQTILEELANIFLLRINAIKKTEPIKHSLKYDSFQHCKKIIDNHFLEIHNLEDIAGRSGIDAAYCCRLFKDFHQQSPYRYLISLKMKQACWLLHKAKILISEVAHTVGYEDVYHFSRVFKKEIGIPPSDYARQYQSLE